MLPMTREWVAKAESDYDGACEALRSRKKSRRDFLAHMSCPFCCGLCLPVEPQWSTFDRAFADMTQFAVVLRYPGTWATLSEAQSGIRSCRRFRSIARQALGAHP